MGNNKKVHAQPQHNGSDNGDQALSHENPGGKHHEHDGKKKGGWSKRRKCCCCWFVVAVVVIIAVAVGLGVAFAATSSDKTTVTGPDPSPAVTPSPSPSALASGASPNETPTASASFEPAATSLAPGSSDAATPTGTPSRDETPDATPSSSHTPTATCTPSATASTSASASTEPGETYMVDTFAGSLEFGLHNGPKAYASYTGPDGIALDTAGNLYIAESGRNLIRLINVTSGLTSWIAGRTTLGSGLVDGVASTAKFNSPQGIVVDAQGNIYVTDTNNHCMRLIADGNVTTIAGSLTGEYGYLDGVGTDARFTNPKGMTIGPDGDIYVGDAGNHAIRKMSVTTFNVTWIAGSTSRQAGYVDGAALIAQFRYPSALAFNATGYLLVADKATVPFVL